MTSQIFVVDDQLVLTHHGVKGMKWGVRKSRAETGMSRHMSSRHEKNAYRIHTTQKALGKRTKGEGLAVKMTRFSLSGQRLVLGKKRFQKIQGMRIATMQQQNKRIEKGKTTTLDKLQVGLTTSIADLASTPNKRKY